MSSAKTCVPGLRAAAVAANRPAGESLITLHPAAPPKPAPGAPCNGCGACCAAQPCPLSFLLLGHRTGSCPALQWLEPERLYACGMVMAPANFLRWLPQRWNAFAARRCARWIAAGSGCDFDAEISDYTPDQGSGG